MADEEKTQRLRERLEAIKPQTTPTNFDEPVVETDEQRKIHKAWGNLGSFIGKNAAFWGAQYLVLSKAHIQPFQWWESVIVLAGIIAVISHFKK